MSAAPDRERADRIRSVPIFSELGDTVVERILEAATEYEVAAGHVLIQPDQAGAGLFIIEDGTVLVERKSGTMQLGAGEFLGELALLDEGATHSARVRAAGPVRFLALARDDFTDLIESEPSLALSMLKVLARRLWQTTRS